MVAEPALPGSHRRSGCRFLGQRKDQPLKPGEAAAQGANATLSRQPVIRKDNATQEIDALSAALQYRLVGVNRESEALQQESIDRLPMTGEGFRIVGQDYEVIDVAQVALDFEAVFDELVEFVQIDVGKKLAGQAADRHAAPWGRMKQRFVSRYLGQEVCVATCLRGGVNGALLEDGGCNLVKLFSGFNRVGQTRQGSAPDFQDPLSVYAGEEGANVQFAEPAMVWLSNKVLQSINSGLCSLVLAIGIAVVNEPGIEPRHNVTHKPLVNQSVSESRGKNFPQFRVGDGKYGEWLRLVASFGDRLGLGIYQFGQVDEPSAFMFAIASIGGAGKQLPCNPGRDIGVWAS